MSKMTTEQFLSHLGIEVDQEFIKNTDNSLKYRIHKNAMGVHYIQFKNRSDTEWRYHTASLSELLNNEITPLPKYTLTEEEKAIVMAIPNVYKWIARDYEGNLTVFLYKPEHNPQKSFWCSSEPSEYRQDLSIFSHLFKFVVSSDEEPASLDELRKCL